MAKINLCSSILTVFCIACSGTDSNVDVVDENETPINNPENTGSISFNYGDTEIIANEVSIINTVRGNEVELIFENSEDGFYFYDGVIINNMTHNGYSLFGEDVTGSIWTYSQRWSPIFDSEIELEGTFATSVPVGIISYQGNYFAAFPVNGNDDGYVITPIHIEVDFNNGELTGFDYRRLDIINIDGNVDGTSIEGTIYGPQGTLEFSGGVFGPEGQEIAGVFESGEVVGFIYGEYDEERTDLIN